jgi:excisionase family DNA binding protein
MKKTNYITIPALAKILGISRIAVYKKVKKGQIKAAKVGRNFAIPKRYVDFIVGKEVNEHDRNIIAKAVKKTIKEYGETLKLLGRE